MIPDIERVISEHLRGDDAVEALVGRRVVAYPPDDDRRGNPWVRLAQLDARQNDTADHLAEFLIQLDCYAGGPGGTDGGQPEASLLARTIRHALQTMPQADHIDGVVVSSVRVTGMLRLPDTDMEPARERVILTAVIHAHS